MPAGEMRDLLKGVGVAAATRAVQPVLTGVKLEAHDDLLTASATDLEVGVRRAVPAVVRRAGACCLDHARLLKVLAEVDGVVELAAEGDGVRVRVVGQKGKWDLPARDPAEFPAVPEANGGAGATADAPALHKAIRQAEYAANRKDNSPRYSVNGVRFEAGGPGLMLVGTDLKRVGVGECPAAVGDGWPADVLVPVRAVKMIAALPDYGTVSLSATRNDLIVTAGDTVVYTRLVNGKFPDWRKIVPKGAAHTFAADAAGFGAAVRRAAVTSDDESKRVDIRFAGGVATLTARGPDTGESEVEVDVPGADFEMAVAFDPAYLGDIFRACLEAGSPTCEVELTDGCKPAVFRWAGGMGLVMPMGDRE